MAFLLERDLYPEFSWKILATSVPNLQLALYGTSLDQLLSGIDFLLY